jgi:2-polyprenyl-6-methoxyphenol hydroxylase-like FAD-dependent oxidoreductase
MKTDNNTYKCCICGGGPAGMMLGYILARAGITIIVLEKHKDFFRDFRGDTIHPSTIQLMYELGILDEFLKVPHQELPRLNGVYNGVNFALADFSHLPVVRKVVGLMPQWDFLNFIEQQAIRYPSFHIMKEAEVDELIWQNNRVVGIKAKTNNGPQEIYADLIVGTDGRHSTVRSLANLKVLETGVPIDVLWFRLPHEKGDPDYTLGRFSNGKIMVTLFRDTYWQCAYVIPKGAFESIQARGLASFKEEIVDVANFFSDRVNELKSWDNIKLLTVAIDHLEKWYCNGLLCIGDAAHAMSPVGGVGINLAVQDAVATANILYKPLAAHQQITQAMLKKVQDRRAFPTKVIQKVQAFLHKNIINRKSAAIARQRMPLFFKLLNAIPLLRRIPAYLVGIGVRPEHIKTPDVFKGK